MTTTSRKMSLLRVALLWVFTLAGLGAWAENESVTHSFADEAIYDGLTPQLFFADLSATDIPTAATNMGLFIKFNEDIRLDFVYDPAKVTGNNRPRTTGYYYADTRCLNIYGSATAANRVQLKFSSPTGAKIKSVRIDGRVSTAATSYASYAPGSANTNLLIDGVAVDNTTATGITWATKNENNYFIWEGTAETVAIEKTTSGTWYLLSFTVEYEADQTKARVPVISGDDAPFLFEKTVSISSADAGATYYYTTDGSEPTTASTVYTAPFTISETTTVKAIATVAGRENSAVASTTFEKIPLRACIADLNTNATAATKEYVQLTGAVVTWVDGDNVYVQDNSTEMRSGLRLLSNPAELKEGDVVTGILQGTYSPFRHEMNSGSSFLNEPTITAGGSAPIAEVEYDVLATPCDLIPSNVYTNMDYLNQRVHFVTTADRVGAAYKGFAGQTLVNALTDGSVGVQVVLPADDLNVVVGGEYGFSGVLYEFVANSGGTRAFRTLHVAQASDITSAEGLALGTLKLDIADAYIVVGETAQIGVTETSHEAAMSYKSNDESVATVSATGLITGVGAGTTYVTATLASDGTIGSASQRVAVTVVAPVYQLPNSDFAEWEHLNVTGGYYWEPLEFEGDEPLSWNGYVGLSKSDSQMEKNADGSVHLTAAVVENSHQPGLLTNANDIEVPLSATYAPNWNNAYVYDVPATASQFTGLPDAIKVVVKGSLTADNASVKAVLFTRGFKALPDNLDADDKAALGTEGTTIATAEKNDIASSDDWQEITIPLNYQVTDGTRPAYAIVSITTNNTPATGTASSYEEDYLDVQSVSFVYDTSLEATYDGVPVEFELDDTYAAWGINLYAATIPGEYDESKLTLKSGLASVINTSYYGNSLTIEIAGDDYDYYTGEGSSSMYVIQFESGTNDYIATIGELTLGDTNVATFVAKKNVDFWYANYLSGLQAYIVTEANASSVTLTSVPMAFAGEAVILTGATGDYELDPLYDDDIDFYYSDEDHAGNLLQVSDGANAVGDGIYALGALNGETEAAFHQYTGTTSLSEGRVFLQILGATSRKLSISLGDDTPTGISHIENGKLNIENKVYDLQGRAMRNGQRSMFNVQSSIQRKGIYVVKVNGQSRKMIIK